MVHSGETWMMAKEKIERGLDRAIFHQHKALKVIHGYGSLSGSAVIAPQAIAYMRHLAETHDARFSKDNHNPGASIIWLNRKRTQSLKIEESEPLIHTSDDTFGCDWFDQAIQKGR